MQGIYLFSSPEGEDDIVLIATFDEAVEIARTTLKEWELFLKLGLGRVIDPRKELHAGK